MTSRILQEDSGLILTESSDVLINNNSIGVDSFSTGTPVVQSATILVSNTNRILQQDLGRILTQNSDVIINNDFDDGVITASPILTGQPVVGLAELNQNYVFLPYDILTGRPDVESAPDPNAQFEQVEQQMFGGWPKRIYEHTDLAVARGHSNGYRSIYKFGYNPDVDGTEETVWGNGGNYPWFTGELTVFISSSSANDSGTGTGARTILIQGLDEDYKEIEETITLNGQTQITSQLSYLRIYRAFVTLAGSGGSAAGIIYIGSSGATGGVPNTSVYASLSLGNQTQIAAYTVPAGHTLYVDEINFTAAVSQANKLVTCKFVSREFGSNVFRTRFIQVLQSNQLIQTFKYPQAFAEKSDVECRASTDTTNTALGASFQGVLIKNDT